MSGGPLSLALLSLLHLSISLSGSPRVDEWKKGGHPHHLFYIIKWYQIEMVIAVDLVVAYPASR